MSLLDKAKIVQAPSGYDTSSLNSVIPSNGNADFDFTRASSATRTNENGLIETVSNNVPRINYDVDSNDDVSCGYLLLEPEATNTATKSNDFSNAGGADIFVSSNNPTEGNITLTADNATSPDGTTNATKITATAGSAKHRVGYFSAVVTSNDTNVLSVFAKKGTGADYLSLRADGYDLNYRANFNLNNGTVGSTQNVTSPKMEYFGNGWYRCSIHFKTTTDVDGAISLIMQNADDFNDFNAVGTEFIFLFGIQCEATTKDDFIFPTSYIPTTGSTVTRSAEVCGNAGSSALFSNTEGVLFVEMAALVNAQDGEKEITVNDGTADNRFSIRYVATINQVFIFARVNSTNVISKNFILTDSTDFSKIAFKFKTGDSALWVDGTERKTDTAAFTVPGGTDLSQIDFRRSGVDGNTFEGKVKQLVYFNEALSDAELTSLTT
jgi:hypothetical protein